MIYHTFSDRALLLNPMSLSVSVILLSSTITFYYNRILSWFIAWSLWKKYFAWHTYCFKSWVSTLDCDIISRRSFTNLNDSSIKWLWISVLSLLYFSPTVLKNTLMLSLIDASSYIFYFFSSISNWVWNSVF